MHPAPPDVQRGRHLVQVETAEAEAALGLLECLQPSAGPSFKQRRIPFVLVDGFADSLDLAAHQLETRIGVVDVCLLGGQFGVFGH